MPSTLSGNRIREARRRAGKTQVALAREAGISASYLNLIEHNRRRIGGTLLNTIADALGVRATTLAEGANTNTLRDLRATASEHPAAEVDPSTAEALAGRFPEWAQLLVDLNRQLRDRASVISALSDRLTHDPLLAENVHAMLSHITAIRSTADILSHVEDIPRLQQRRFHETMAQESEKLTETAQALADYLGAAADPEDSSVTAEEALDRFLRRNAYSFDAMDREAEAAANLPQAVYASRMAEVIDGMLGPEATLPVGPGRTLIRQHLQTYGEDARRLPLHAFHEAGQRLRYEPMALAAAFEVDVPTVFRRLAVLKRPWIDAPLFGLVVVSASGYPLLRHPRPDFAMPRHGNACPLWPVFRAFARPGEAMLDRIEHDTGSTFLTLTYAAPRYPTAFGARADLAASMLVVAEEDFPGPVTTTAKAAAVGTSCRVCSRKSCPSRVENALLS